MTGGSLLGAVLLFVWARTDSLPVFYALWIGLGACQSVTLYEPAFAVITRVYGPRYRQAILIMTFLGGLASTFGIPFAQLLIERISWRPTLVVMAAIILAVGILIHWLFVPGPSEKAIPIGAPAPPPKGAARRGPLASAVRVPAFWGLVVAFAGYGLAFSAISFHLIPLLDERDVPIGVVMAIIALIGPMQVVGRVLLMAGQKHITAIQLGAGIYFAFPVSMAMLAAGHQRRLRADPVRHHLRRRQRAGDHPARHGGAGIHRPRRLRHRHRRAHHADQRDARRRPADGRAGRGAPSATIRRCCGALP
jgi:MFS family permease